VILKGEKKKKQDASEQGQCEDEDMTSHCFAGTANQNAAFWIPN
jgi:hypothetical protein